MELDELFAHHFLGGDKPEDYINWGVDQLLAGSDSINMALLASMDFLKPVYMQDVLKQFEKCLEELSISWPDERETIRTYSETIARRITLGEIEPRDGLKRLASLYFPSFYSEDLYAIWYGLEYDVANLEFGHTATSNPEIDLETLDTFIIKVAKQYLELLKMSLPENFLKWAYCYECQQVHQYVVKPVKGNSLLRKLFKKRHEFHVECANCTSSKITTMINYEARQKYLQLLST